MKSENWVKNYKLPKITSFYTELLHLNQARKQLKSNFYLSLEDKVNDCYSNTKMFWRNLNNYKIKQFESTSDITMDDWVKHFSKLLTSEEKNPLPPTQILR